MFRGAAAALPLRSVGGGAESFLSCPVERAELGCLGIGLEALLRGATRMTFLFPLFLFGAIGLLAVAGDLRVVRSGALTGRARIARRLWRMSFALFIGVLSFFLGQAKVIPEPLRKGPLLAVPVLVVLVTMVYWMWRMRARHLQTSVASPAVKPASGHHPDSAMTDCASTSAVQASRARAQ